MLPPPEILSIDNFIFCVYNFNFNIYLNPSCLNDSSIRKPYPTPPPEGCFSPCETTPCSVGLSRPRIVIGSAAEGSLLIPALIRLHEAPYPPMHGKDRLPVSVHTHTSFDRQRKRFLVCARNDTWGGDRLTSSFIPPAILTSRNYFLKSNVRLSRPLVSSSRAQPRDLCCCRFLDSFSNPFA